MLIPIHGPCVSRFFPCNSVFPLAVQLAGPDSGLWSLQTSFYAECYGPLPLEFLEKLGEFQARSVQGVGTERVKQF